MRSQLGLVYTDTPQGPLQLDVHLPAQAPAAPTPVILFIHGGGWRSGDRQAVKGMSIPERGWPLVSIDYRLTAQGVTWPTLLEDCQAAVRWVRQQAGRFGWRSERIGVWGSSAGGHLAAMLAVCAAGPDDPARVQAVCNWCGPTDLTQLHNPAWRVERQSTIEEVTLALIGGPLDQRLAVARAASPVLLVRPGCPPMLTMQGEADDVVSPRHAQPFHERMLACGNHSELHLLPGAGHGFHTPEREALVFDFFQRMLAD